MNILVTGANGQLGNEMQILSTGCPQHTYFFTDVQELDICDAQAVKAFVADKAIDVIVNCAAYTAVDKAEDDEVLCDKLNHIAPGYLADAAEAYGSALIHISTDYVFDGTAHIPYREDAATCPNTVYGRTKLAGEEEVMKRCSRAVIIRTAWLYSTFGNNFVKTMLRLGRERDTLGVIFDQIGTPTYANDLAATIFAIIQQGIVPGIYHFSNEADMLNRIVLGMSAKQFRLANGIEKGQSIRPYLTAQQIHALDRLQHLDYGLLYSCPDFQQRKQMLMTYYKTELEG